MGLINDLPAWIQEIRDRADKATPGPWTPEDANPHKPHKRFAFYIPEIMSAPSMPQYDGLTTEDAEFIAHSRTDVPRLVELVGEMAEALEAALEHLSLGQYVASPGKCRVCGGYVHTKCLTVCEQCAARMVREVLTKYHGEVENA